MSDKTFIVAKITVKVFLLSGRDEIFEGSAGKRDKYESWRSDSGKANRGSERRKNMAQNIRKAVFQDLSRIAEILVFVKRMNYRPIFKNDSYSFGELQVLSVAEAYALPDIFNHIWVYDDGIVKGMIRIEGKEIRELYVDSFFQNQGVGAELIEFAQKEFSVDFLWALEKNTDAIRFYERHGFHRTETKRLEEGTTEYLILLEG